MKKGTRVDLVKTSLQLPRDVWAEAKKRAVDERSDFRTVIIKALEEYLRKPLRRTKGG